MIDEVQFPTPGNFFTYQAWRRKKVAELSAGGMSNSEIARALKINLSTVSTDLAFARKKNQ